MKVFARSGFRDLLLGQTVSALGDWMATIALMVLVLRLSGSSTAVAGVLVLRLVPAVVGGSAAARALRRWDRRRTMLTMDLARAGLVLLVPLVHALWWVYVWAFLLEVLGLVFLPARDAAVPDLVDRDDLATANGAVLASSFGTIPFGAGAFAAVAALSPATGRFPFVAVFVLDAVTYLVSFGFIRRLRLPPRTSGPVTAPSEPDAPLPGLRAAFRIPLVRAVMPATVVIALGLGTLFSIGIVFVRDAIGAADAEFGVLVVLFGVGAGGGLAVLRWIHDLPVLAKVRWATAAQGMTIAVMSISPSIGPVFLGAFAFGAATAVALATGMSALQDRLEGTERDLAFAAFHTTIRAGLAFSAVAAGAAADVFDRVDFPGFGHLSSARVVLLCAGLVVVAGSSMVRGSETVRDDGLGCR
jgi:predicted MFS family arabinose efflux permease